MPTGDFHMIERQRQAELEARVRAEDTVRGTPPLAGIPVVPYDPNAIFMRVPEANVSYCQRVYPDGNATEPESVITTATAWTGGDPEWQTVPPYSPFTPLPPTTAPLSPTTPPWPTDIGTGNAPIVFPSDWAPRVIPAPDPEAYDPELEALRAKKAELERKKRLRDTKTRQEAEKDRLRQEIKKLAKELGEDDPTPAQEKVARAAKKS